MKTLLIVATAVWTTALFAMTPWPQPPVLDPYASPASLLTPDEVLCATSTPGALFLLRREGTKENWYKVLDFDAGMTLREMDVSPTPGGFTAALLLAGPQSTLLTLIRVSGDQPAQQIPLKVIPGNLFPRNLRVVPEGDDGAIVFFLLSKSDHRDRILTDSWDRLYALRVDGNRVVYDREVGDEDAVNAGSYAPFMGPGGSVGVLRQRFAKGDLQVVPTRIGADGRVTREKPVLSMRPSAPREDCLLTLDASPDGSEVRALLTEPTRSHFYRVGADGEIRQRVTFDLPYVLLGYDPQGPRLLAADTRTPAIHWLTFSSDRPCDEAFEFPKGTVRLRQPPAACRWWMEVAKGGPLLKKYCQKGCLPPG